MFGGNIARQRAVAFYGVTFLHGSGRVCRVQRPHLDDEAHSSTEAVHDSSLPSLLLDDDPSAESGGAGIIGSALAVGGLLAVIGLSVMYQDSIRNFLVYFATVIEDWGPRGVLAYFVVYTALEVLAVPAIPLTMTAGAIFGIIPGSLLTSLAGTLAATISFLIARYVARDRVRHPLHIVVNAAHVHHGHVVYQ